MHLERVDDVFVLHLGDGENRYTADSVAELTELVATVEATPGPRAMVTVGDGKFWSNGLDLDWLRANEHEAPGMFIALHELYAMVLEASFPTVAALQGHCYAGGAIMAMAYDVRIMREDRGFFCFPEVDLGLAFTPGMSALVASKLAPQAAREAMVFGRRFTAPDAASAGIIDETASVQEVLPRAIALAAGLTGKHQATMRTIKQNLYAPALAALRASANARVEGLFSS